MRSYRIFLSVFLLVVGMMIIGIWSMLLISGNITDIPETIFSFVFHWISELLTALLSTAAAVALLQQKKRAFPAALFALGMVICSTAMASFHYVFTEFDPKFLFLLASLFAAASTLAVCSFRFLPSPERSRSGLFRFGLMALGILTYFLINTAGRSGGEEDWASFFISLFLTGAALFTATKLALPD